MTMSGVRAAMAAALLIAPCAPAGAGTLRCSFAEPFFDLEFDSATGRVVYTSPHELEDGTGKPKPRVIAEGARVRRSDVWDGYETWFLETPAKDRDTSTVTIVEIKVTGRGSDGMSETVFPFEGRHGGWLGGCESSRAPAYDSYEAFRDLGVEDQK